jgi:hypothetical protein
LAEAAEAAVTMAQTQGTLDTQVIKSPGVVQFKQLIVYKFILVAVVAAVRVMHLVHLVGQPEQAVLGFLAAEEEMLDPVDHQVVVVEVVAQL